MGDDTTNAADFNAKPYPRLCTECGQTAVMSAVIAYDAEVRHDGRVYGFPIPRLTIDKCERCGEEFFTNRTDEQISNALRERLGLLQPQDIRRRLGELGLTQRSFAERLGVAPETVSRWLNGLSIQTRALDNLMRVFFGFALVRDVLPPDGPARTLGLLTAESGASYERWARIGWSAAALGDRCRGLRVVSHRIHPVVAYREASGRRKFCGFARKKAASPQSKAVTSPRTPRSATRLVPLERVERYPYDSSPLPEIV